jgi:hypothetical protein
MVSREDMPRWRAAASMRWVGVKVSQPAYAVIDAGRTVLSAASPMRLSRSRRATQTRAWICSPAPLRGETASRSPRGWPSGAVVPMWSVGNASAPGREGRPTPPRPWPRGGDGVARLLGHHPVGGVVRLTAQLAQLEGRSAAPARPRGRSVSHAVPPQPHPLAPSCSRSAQDIGHSSNKAHPGQSPGGRSRPSLLCLPAQTGPVRQRADRWNR